MSGTYLSRGREERNHVISKEFNIDNGAGTTDDDLILHHNTGIEVYAADAVYTEASDSGDASGATVQIGTTQSGTDIVASSNLENSKAVSSTTGLTLASSRLSANGEIWVRHTGIAATQVGKYKVVLEYRVLPA